MIESKSFFDALSMHGIGFYTGVPDSLLANFCAYVDDQGGRDQHLITANEGNAIAVAMGYHMATGKFAAVYMQNSGLGNSVNPLTSLADTEVYKVPILLIIGWRGEPGSKDEPQHIKQGRVTLDQLKILEIPYWVLDANSSMSVLDAVFASMKKRNGPVALVVRKDTFASYKSVKKRLENSTLTREEALEQLLNLCGQNFLIVSTTGKTSREVFELRAKHGKNQRDFLTVGGMGHTSSIALGVAIGLPERHVVCLDGDGSLLMHMGAMPVIVNYKPKKFLHVLLNNESHESVGGQSTSAGNIDFHKLADAVGYEEYASADDVSSLKSAWMKLIEVEGPVLLEVRIKNGSREELGRPTCTAEENKIAFMEAAGVK
jgi:phosphonopyruvate decarboxylase